MKTLKEYNESLLSEVWGEQKAGVLCDICDSEMIYHNADKDDSFSRCVLLSHPSVIFPDYGSIVFDGRLKIHVRCPECGHTGDKLV
jgi:hypothetical protein